LLNFAGAILLKNTLYNDFMKWKKLKKKLEKVELLAMEVSTQRKVFKYIVLDLRTFILKNCVSFLLSLISI